MENSNPLTTDFRLSHLSTGPSESNCSIAVFAHNEAKNIREALESIAVNTRDKGIEIYVLANGCSDSTVDKVRESADLIDNLWLVETDLADKAGTWNLFIHEILSMERLVEIETCFFMDGDVALAPDALSLLKSALDEVPTAEAAGAMPATGRDKDAWRYRMRLNGMLAGNCYALRSSFIQYIRERNVRMPVGLIGEDFFVSWLVASNVWRNRLPEKDGVRCIFHEEAEFVFRSLSPWRLSDCKTYLRRKWRYTLRGIQHQMLVLMLMRRGLDAIPRDVQELYRKGPLPSRLVWFGLLNALDTIMHLAAVQWVRAQRGKNT